MNDPQKAAATAAAAKSSSMPHATQLLSDLAEAIASGKTVGEFKRDAKI
jgi:UDP-N-acetylglucosamine--N-acetylmuramyl-(pentapeptide) pyrophosphoryl-undecaprenol N-acetylglucosamine transferase